MSGEHVLLAAAKAARQRELIAVYANALDQSPDGGVSGGDRGDAAPRSGHEAKA